MKKLYLLRGMDRKGWVISRGVVFEEPEGTDDALELLDLKEHECWAVEIEVYELKQTKRSEAAKSPWVEEHMKLVEE